MRKFAIVDHDTSDTGLAAVMFGLTPPGEEWEWVGETMDEPVFGCKCVKLTGSRRGETIVIDRRNESHAG